MVKVRLAFRDDHAHGVCLYVHTVCLAKVPCIRDCYVTMG